MKIRGSIVLFHTDPAIVTAAIESFFSSRHSGKLYLIDNSSNDSLAHLSYLDDRIVYKFVGTNIGYGAGHNIALRESVSDSAEYHLVLNPDVVFHGSVMDKLYEYMNMNLHVGNVMPKVKYATGKLQFLCKLLPTPYQMFVRRFMPDSQYKRRADSKYELRHSGYNKIMNVPNLSGCFMFLRTDVLNTVGFFDERFFMYFEDVDLNRRIHKVANTVFFPFVDIIHGYAKGSYINRKLFLMHIRSAVIYFCKWGWFFDRERERFNRLVLQQEGGK